jgi:predicted nucleic acid-binding protein
MYLLDTNVISETIKASPNQKVLDFLSSIDSDNFSLSVITLGEIRKGIEKLTDQAKKQKILHWLEVDLQQRFYGRIIEVNQDVADKWGYICAISNIAAIDAIIAASAIVYNQKLITRNTKDFIKVGGLEIINPWMI